MLLERMPYPDNLDNHFAVDPFRGTLLHGLLPVAR